MAVDPGGGSTGFADVVEAVSRVASRLENIESLVGSISNRVGQIRRHVQNIESNTAKMAQSVEKIASVAEKAVQGVESAGEAVRRVEEEVGERVSEVGDKISRLGDRFSRTVRTGVGSVEAAIARGLRMVSRKLDGINVGVIYSYLALLAFFQELERLFERLSYGLGIISGAIRNAMNKVVDVLLFTVGGVENMVGSVAAGLLGATFLVAQRVGELLGTVPLLGDIGGLIIGILIYLGAMASYLGNVLSTLRTVKQGYDRFVQQLRTIYARMITSNNVVVRSIAQKLAEIKAHLTVLLRPIGAALRTIAGLIGQYLLRVLDKILGGISLMLMLLARVVRMQLFGMLLGGLSRIFGRLMEFGFIRRIVMFLRPLALVAGTLVGKFLVMVGAIATVGAVMGYLAARIMGFDGIVQALRSSLDRIRAKIVGAGNVVSQVLYVIAGGFYNVGLIVQGVGTALAGLASRIPVLGEFFAKLIEFATVGFAGIFLAVGGAVELLGGLIEGLVSMLGGAFNFINMVVGAVFGKVVDLGFKVAMALGAVVGVTAWLVGGVASFTGWVRSAVDAVGAFIEWVSRLPVQLWQALQGVVGAVVGWFVRVVSAVRDLIAGSVGRIIEWVGENILDRVAVVASAITSIRDIVSDIGSALRSVMIPFKELADAVGAVVDVFEWLADRIGWIFGRGGGAETGAGTGRRFEADDLYWGST